MIKSKNIIVQIPRAWYGINDLGIPILLSSIHNLKLKNTKNMATEEKTEGLQSKCGPLTTDVQNNGAPIDKPTAVQYVSNYLTGVHDGTGKDHDFGYLFGLKKVTAFMEQIAKYNADKPLKQIAGVRIYVARQSPIKAGTVVPMEKVMDSLFLMPVLTDGTDLYKMNDFAGNDIILGNPRPCPNECKSLSFLE
jgi:hypothetical protein